MPFHPLCPVHSRAETPEIIWDGRTPALAGPAHALAKTLRRIEDSDDVEISWSVCAWPELPPEHPQQFLVMMIEVAGAPRDLDFRDFGNGAFLIPAGSTIEKSAAGELCVYRADPERHTALSSRPIPGLN